MTEPTDCATHPSNRTSWTVGQLTVHRIDETGLPPETGPWLLPDATADVVSAHPWLRPQFVDENRTLLIDSHSFAFVVDGTRVLVDTGVGNHKQRANPAWHQLDTDYLQRLSDAGFAPESVDLVILTHLHADHVGWNTRLASGQWVPTFPNARYLTARAEREFWAGYDMDAARSQMFADSVEPVDEAGQLDLVEVRAGGLEVADGVRLIPTPGHTPGHLAVELRSHGHAALITGDSIHHPVQLARPDICASVDIDPTQARATRHGLLAEAARTSALLLGTHFAPPAAGVVVADGEAYRLKGGNG